MKTLILAASLLGASLLGASLLGIDFGNQNAWTYPSSQIERPTVNLPKSLWQHNWNNGRSGSCVVASTIDILRWQGQFAAATKLRSSYGGGWDDDDWCRVLDKEGIDYDRTKGNIAFLEVACATRRGCIVTINVGNGSYHYTTQNRGYHCVALVHLDPADSLNPRAGILDNNLDKIVWLSREEFLRYWFASSGTWAIAPVYTPTSPRIP